MKLVKCNIKEATQNAKRKLWLSFIIYTNNKHILLDVTIIFIVSGTTSDERGGERERERGFNGDSNNLHLSPKFKYIFF